MTEDWVDSYNGEASSLGPNPYGFDGSPNSKYAPAQQQQGGGMGAGTLTGLAQALMKYGGSNATLGASTAGTGYPTQYGTSSDPYLGGEAPMGGGVPYD